ncbi:macrophage mannose receptor 1-like [Perca fluviatilis]|uniref:macrophage mannose receptor 1-like n=1 Tax=Perca fluviatilis TaxID=8168 RepID=UPI001962CC93|nr:macrophage mannose receptor 1-like [Perca fluviatilis]
MTAAATSMGLTSEGPSPAKQRLTGLIAVAGFLFLIFVVFLMKKAWCEEPITKKSAVESVRQDDVDGNVYETSLDMVRSKDDENVYENLPMDGPEDKVTSMLKMLWSLFVFIVMGQCSSIGGQLYDYHFIGENMTWKAAQKYCRKYHTDLATVSNQTDMKRLLNSTTEQYPDGAWIGLQDNTPNIVWHWSLPGVKFNETESKWSQGEPNNLGKQENCVMKMKNDKWNDISCSNSYNFICYDEDKKSDKTFYISHKKMNWTDAQRFCRENYTDLISGVKQLGDFKTQHQNDAETFWIGLFRDCWCWSDGSNFSFRSWDKDPKKSCAMTTLNGKWSSDDCDETKPFFCYNDSVILINQSMIWEDALYYCRDRYGDLVSITNLDDQRWVQERAKMASTPHVWLGLRYTCTLDFWFWVSDETVHYKNWALPQSGNNCNMSGAMDRNGTWVKKIDDNHKLNFICSKN